MDLVLLFHCRRAIPLVLMFVLLSSLPALCSAEAVPVHFHNTGSSLLGSRLLVLGFTWRRYAYFVQARVLSYVLHAAILADLAPSSRALAANFPLSKFSLSSWLPLSHPSRRRLGAVTD